MGKEKEGITFLNPRIKKKAISLEDFLGCASSNLESNLPQLKTGPVYIHLNTSKIGISEEEMYHVNGVISANKSAVNELVDNRYIVGSGLVVEQTQIGHYAIIKRR